MPRRVALTRKRPATADLVVSGSIEDPDIGIVGPMATYDPTMRFVTMDDVKQGDTLTDGQDLYHVSMAQTVGNRIVCKLSKEA